jgi:uncharacterized protein YbaA (DUF1428 family)
MYIAGLVIPMPEARMDAYRQWTESEAQIFKDLSDPWGILSRIQASDLIH